MDPTKLYSEGRLVGGLPTEREITVTVQVSIPISLVFDAPPTLDEIRKAALENFIQHPVLDDVNDLEMYVDSIGNGEMDLDRGGECKCLT